MPAMRNNKTTFASNAATALAATGLFLGGCAGSPRTPESVNVAVATPATPDVPAPEPADERGAWMIDESQLPQGFPPPGPVGKIIEKQYPPSRVAEVRSSDLNGAGMNRMFNPLFNHIKNNQISMTSPVVMDLSEQQPGRTESMAFVYADPEIGSPGEAEGNVRVEDVAPLTVLSITQRGGYGEANFRQGEEKLRTWLQENPGRYEVIGPSRVLAYNSPLVPWFLKLSEVQIPVRPLDASDTMGQ
jgi:hypothetical protein